jgi:hypothetical protein
VSSPQVTPITGLPQVNGWAQVITHPSRSLFCVLAVSGENANSVGKTLAEYVAHFKVSDSAKLHNALLDLLQNARREQCSLQLACILMGEEKNILATNGGSVFLKRNHRVGEILSSESELKIIEGKKVDNDVFVLATHQATATFPQLRNILHRQTEDIVPQLVAQLQNKENSSLSAMAWVESKPAEKEVKNIKAADFANPLQKLTQFVNLRKVTRTLQKLPASRLRNPVLLAKKFGKKIKSWLINLRRSSPKIAGESSKTSTKRFIMAASGVIVVLAGLIGWKQYRINQEVQALEPYFSKLQQQLTDAQALADEQPLAARIQAKEVMRGLEDLIADNQDKKEAIKVLKEQYQAAQTFAETVSGSENQGPLDPFFDLRLAESGFVTTDATVNENRLLALDASGNKAVLLELENKQTSPLPFEDIGEARAITIEEDDFYVLADGLHVYDLTDNNQHLQLKEQGDSDRAGTLLESFGTYLYVFNPEERNVYRYLRNDDELSEPIGWLVEKQNFDFSAIQDMAIDGDIWFTTDSGEIWKYTQGSRQNFTAQELTTPFDSSLKIATHPESEYLFVLENSKQRLVVLNKEGLFLKEVVSESFSSAESLAASRTENAVYVISGSLVYKISL